jgi:hypothetical protein
MTREQKIEAAAIALIAAIDRNLDTRPWPWKYGVPWAEANALREAIEARPLPAMGRIPPGARS